MMHTLNTPFFAEEKSYVETRIQEGGRITVILTTNARPTENETFAILEVLATEAMHTIPELLGKDVQSEIDFFADFDLSIEELKCETKPSKSGKKFPYHVVINNDAPVA